MQGRAKRCCEAAGVPPAGSLDERLQAPALASGQAGGRDQQAVRPLRIQGGHPRLPAHLLAKQGAQGVTCDAAVLLSFEPWYRVGLGITEELGITAAEPVLAEPGGTWQRLREHIKSWHTALSRKSQQRPVRCVSWPYCSCSQVWPRASALLRLGRDAGVMRSTVCVDPAISSAWGCAVARSGRCHHFVACACLAS